MTRPSYKNLYHALYIKHLALKGQLIEANKRLIEAEKNKKHLELIRSQIKSWSK